MYRFVATRKKKQKKRNRPVFRHGMPPQGIPRNKSRMCIQYVTSREPAQQACDHMLIIANFFDSILCIVMFPSDVIKVFLCEVMPSNI